MSTRVTVIGVGNFGYALVKHLDNKGDPSVALTAYDHEPEVIDALLRDREHPFVHRGTKVSERIRFTPDLLEAVDGADVILLAVTSHALAEVCGKIKDAIAPDVVILNTAKALAVDTGERLSTVCERALDGAPHRFAALAGGTIAADLFRHEPLGADVACVDVTTAERLAVLLSSENLSVYPTTDLVGLEYAAAFKNVVSILAGIIKGMGYSYGSETHVISRAAHEIEMIATHNYGARPETFSMHSQCWGNDLWMSCTGPTRNREFGILVGEGRSADDALAIMAGARKTVEGVQTIRALARLASLRRYPMIAFLTRLIAGESDISEVQQIIQAHRF